MSVSTRGATLADLPALVALNHAAYPDLIEDGIVFAEEQLRAHQEVFAEGQRVAQVDGRVVGAIATLVLPRAAQRYVLKFDSGKYYVGKGSRYRSEVSARRIADKHRDIHIETEWSPSPGNSHREAFKMEHRTLDQMSQGLGPADPKSYNAATSPGKKYIQIDGF